MAAVNFRPLFYPNNIAVIGVSNNPVGGLKYIVAHELSGYEGGLYPINPKYEEIGGRKVYPSLDAEGVPDIDLCVIAIPAKFVPDAVRQCHRKGVKFAIIFSSGFGEAGNEELDSELVRAIAEGPTRVVGPNCLGVLNTESNVTYFPGMEYHEGNISIVSQSGGTTARLMAFLTSLGMGMANVVSIGNSVDLTVTDFLEYFKDDPRTEVVVLYMESIRDGRRFLEVLKEVTREKRVIVWKGGQTEVGGIAAQSHTGGLAGSYEVWKAALRQGGAIHGEYFEQVVDLVIACALKVPLPKNKKVGVVISGGGLCVEFTDTLIKHGLEVP
ncbi:MAG: CoA-binding protein, partial [Promethearchaeota archaeon]